MNICASILAGSIEAYSHVILLVFVKMRRIARVKHNENHEVSNSFLGFLRLLAKSSRKYLDVDV